MFLTAFAQHYWRRVSAAAIETMELEQNLKLLTLFFCESAEMRTSCFAFSDPSKLVASVCSCKSGSTRNICMSDAQKQCRKPLLLCSVSFRSYRGRWTRHKRRSTEQSSSKLARGVIGWSATHCKWNKKWGWSKFFELVIWTDKRPY